MFLTPAPSPLPSIVWPSRLTVMPLAFTIRPSKRQSTRSLRTRTTWFTFMPQCTKVGTGAALMVQS